MRSPIVFSKNYTLWEFIDKVWLNYAKNINEILKNNNIVLNQSDIVDFNTACFIAMKLNSEIPSSSKIVLEKWNLVSYKYLSDIQVWESIYIDYFPFNEYDKELKCISKECRRENFLCKLFQLEWPRMLFRIDDWAEFSYCNWKYFLDDPVNELKSVDDFESWDDCDDESSFKWKWYIYLIKQLFWDSNAWLDYLKNEIEEYEEKRLIYEDIVSHKKGYKKTSFPIEDIIESMNKYPESIYKTEDICKKCWNNLVSIHFCSPAWTWESLCGRAWDMLICPHCKTDFWIYWSFVMN